VVSLKQLGEQTMLLKNLPKWICVKFQKTMKWFETRRIPTFFTVVSGIVAVLGAPQLMSWYSEDGSNFVTSENNVQSTGSIPLENKIVELCEDSYNEIIACKQGWTTPPSQRLEQKEAPEKVEPKLVPSKVPKKQKADTKKPKNKSRKKAILGFSFPRDKVHSSDVLHHCFHNGEYRDSWYPRGVKPSPQFNCKVHVVPTYKETYPYDMF